MRSHRRLLWLLAILPLLSGCSLLVDFDPEGQPCNAQNQCLQDYVCVDGGCVSKSGPKSDGGTGGTRLCEDPAHCPESPPEAR